MSLTATIRVEEVSYGTLRASIETRRQIGGTRIVIQRSTDFYSGADVSVYVREEVAGLALLNCRIVRHGFLAVEPITSYPACEIELTNAPPLYG